MKTQDAPIFIIGVHRSGTTLLRYMLSSSPRIHIPPESDFIPRFFLRRPTAPLSEQRVTEMLKVIFDRYRFVNQWRGDPPPAGSFLHNGPPTPAAFLDRLYTLYAQQHSAVRWGDKTPIYSSYVDLLHEIFPEAQFIHLMRDGRDVALSTLDKWGKKKIHFDMYFAARNWARRTRQARQAEAELGPQQYYELRYENLVADPARELRPICEFLNEPFYPEMAEPQRLGQKDIAPGTFHAPVRQPPSTARIARWRKEMSPQDLRLFQHIAGPLLEETGYPLVDGGVMTPAEKARLAALAAKYMAFQTGRRMAQMLGLAPPV
ncbi:MAG: sulfotransferase [Chloroflexi bacterium]|nr:sulfotransferase [Chloroflexota bacterium]